MFYFRQKSPKNFQKWLLEHLFLKICGVPKAQNLQKHAIKRDWC
jgi:hypothetical protein